MDIFFTLCSFAFSLKREVAEFWFLVFWVFLTCLFPVALVIHRDICVCLTWHCSSIIFSLMSLFGDLWLELLTSFFDNRSTSVTPLWKYVYVFSVCTWPADSLTSFLNIIMKL